MISDFRNEVQDLERQAAERHERRELRQKAERLGYRWTRIDGRAVMTKSPPPEKSPATEQDLEAIAFLASGDWLEYPPSVSFVRSLWRKVRATGTIDISEKQRRWLWDIVLRHEGYFMAAEKHHLIEHGKAMVGNGGKWAAIAPSRSQDDSSRGTGSF